MSILVTFTAAAIGGAVSFEAALNGSVWQHNPQLLGYLRAKRLRLP